MVDSLTPRGVAGLLATPGCERRSRLVATGVDLDSLAVSLGGEEVGQSPFALARSAQFEARLKSQGYAELRDLIQRHLGIEVAGAVASDLASCLADRTPRLHILGPQRLGWPGGGLETDGLLVVSGETLHLVGVRTYAMVGEVADPAKVAATSRELAVEIVALRSQLPEVGRCSTRTLLVLPKNFGLSPTAAVLDVAPQVARVRALSTGLEWGGEAPEWSELRPKFGDGCPQCPMMGACAGELVEQRRVARLGSAVANVVGGTVDEALLDPPPDLGVRQRLQAMRDGRSVRRTTRRHVHLHDRPLVVVGYHLAGEPAAVLALHYGTSPEDGKLLVAAEPRDREQRLALLREFAADLSSYVEEFAAVEPIVRRDMTVVECAVDAPQLITPNSATAQWLTDLLARYLRGSEDLAAQHLSWFGSRRVLPGSSVTTAMTDVLTTHWATGQLPAEDVHLPSLLSWLGETVDDVPMGPIPDPHWDSGVLAPALGAPGLVTAAVSGPLATAWSATWRSLGLVRAELPEIGAHVGDRWERDRWSFTRHRERVAEGTASVAARLSGVPAFRFLHELETRTVALERQMALDDPLVMTGYLISGDALSGTVSKVDREHTLASPTGRELLRPRIWLHSDAEFGRPLGTQLWLATDPRVMVTVTAVEPGGVELLVQKGAVQRNALGRLPQIGEEVVFAPFGGEDAFPSRLPEQLPWQFGTASPDPADAPADPAADEQQITDVQATTAQVRMRNRDLPPTPGTAEGGGASE
ncbi:hypothetical protein HDA40_003897 [Hamadaea flava]|uniref:hypothetical protein n=1 Tax=Hamadaea flava TaxID=1742688 RepID=UPI0020A30F18|nr:hypothetical protein [Hamadaea flava]MCP2325390.1 hypothetical protein [Hamadaea flava]